MESIQSLQWFREKGLVDEAQKHSLLLKKIFSSCFGITDEKILIIGDIGFEKRLVSPLMAASLFFASKAMNLNSKLILQTPRSRMQDADPEVVESLLGLEEKNVVFVVASDKLGAIGDAGKSFRAYCARKKHKFITSTSLGDLPTAMFKEVIGAIDVDYKPLWAEHQRWKEIFDAAKEVRVTTAAGTDLRFNKESMVALKSDGAYNVPGLGGNMPAGEVYFPCSGNKVDGVVVIDGSSRNHKHTAVIKTPIKLTIEKGGITSIEGGEEAKELEKTLQMAAEHSKRPKTVYRVSELGFGLNRKAKIIGSTLVDEKAYGTAHIGIGSNYWFGGNIYAIIHLDQIFKNPVVEVDGQKVVI
ncbi:aminopeptidase [Candidatus Woesearchaeota archaeon]|nr:aminopeptidase [Candidatus Woesearchaeota archaeon]